MRCVTITLCALSALTLGCASVISVNYEPTNSWKGQGTLTVLPFRYDAADERRVRARQVESNQASLTELFLFKEIGSFFTEALQRELIHSGYRMADSAPLTVSGSIARFYAGWKTAADRLFELHVTYDVRAGEQILFTWTCFSAQEGPGTLTQDSLLIRKGTEDCMQRFIQASQEANVL